MHADAPQWTEHVLNGTLSQADTDAYRELSGNAARGVAVVSTVHRGWDNAATVTDYLSISYDPPTMLVSLYSLSRIAEALQESGTWGLSLLTGAQTNIADRMSESGNPLVGLLGQIPHFRRMEGGAPLIAGSLAWFELRTTAVHEAATHTLFVGEVTAMGRSADQSAKPLVRYRSGYVRP